MTSISSSSLTSLTLSVSTGAPPNVVTYPQDIPLSSVNMGNNSILIPPTSSIVTAFASSAPGTPFNYSITGSYASQSGPNVLIATPGTSNYIPQQITPYLYLAPLTNYTTDAPFSLTPLVINTGTGALSFSSSNTSVATIAGDTITFVGEGFTTITVSVAVSADNVYAATSTTAIVTVNIPPIFETTLVDSKVYATYSSDLNDAIQGGSSFFTLRFSLGANQFPEGINSINLNTIGAAITARSGDLAGNATSVQDSTSATFSDGYLVITGYGSTSPYVFQNGYKVSIELHNRIRPYRTWWNSFNFNYLYTIEITGLPVLTVSLVQTTTPGNFLLQTPNVGAPFSYKLGYRITDAPSDPLNYLPDIYVTDGNNYSISIPDLQVGVSYSFEVELWHSEYNESRKVLLPNQIFLYTI
jgi:hypothetical protein